MANGVSLVETNIHFLEQGLNLLNNLNDSLYLNTDSKHYDSSIGKHFRHALEHYIALLQHTDGKIDYDARERDGRIERNRGYAIEVVEDILTDLKKYKADPAHLDKKVWIRNNEGAGNGIEASWCESSVNRELHFLISHTVHHYALIAIILKIQDYQPDPQFGVAPSTLRYQEQQEHVTTN